MYRNHRRGLHLANTQGVREHTAREMDALGLLHPGSVALLEHDLYDPRVLAYLEGERAAGEGDLHAFLRLLPPEPLCNVQSYGRHVADVIRAYRGLFYGFVGANEQNVEWFGQASLAQIIQWNRDLWWEVRYNLDQGDDFPLWYPPASPFAEMSHLDYYRDAEADILQRYKRLRWHEYPWPGDAGLVEEGFSGALYGAVVAGEVDSLIGEWGINPGAGGRPGDGGFIDQYVDRFGSAQGGVAGRSVARHACYWLLGSQDPTFDPFALVGPTGEHRQGLFDLAYWGP